MDEKISTLEYPYERLPFSLPSQGTTHRHTLKRFLLAFLISAAIYSLLLLKLPSILFLPYTWPTTNSLSPQQPAPPLSDPPLPASTNITKIPLEAHIMSKCPDARDCLRDFVVPAMEKIADKVDFRLSFIGQLDADGSVHCMHGQTECLGNILSLCAHNLYPNDTKISLGFTTCMIQDYTQIPNRLLVQNCALEHGLDFERLNGCVSEEGKGLDLLEASVRRSRDAGVRYSCTVRLDEKFRCVRDSGRWKDCEGGSRVDDLVGDVEELYRLRNQDA